MLSDGVLAVYLLGYDQATEENKIKLQAVTHITKFSSTANFADNDDEKRAEKAGPFDLRFDVPPSEAIDYFKRKKIVTKKEFEKLSQEAKAASFYVSGIYKKDILEAFHKEITDALESGQTRQSLVKRFKDILDGANHPELGDFHLESIARTNMQMAYGVGRRKQMEDSADLLPFWEYSAVNDDRTRPTHRALDGLIYPANHEFWDTHYPPWGFNCRCSVIATLDYPNNYNHARPNPDTHIVYDEKGLPAKAEYLTQVVDLKATKFVGVPRTANLEAVLKQASQTAQSAKRERDTYKTPQSVIDKAKKIRNEKVEVAHLFDNRGNHLFEVRGTADEVDVEIPDAIAEKAVGGIHLHNHPPDALRNFESFSLSDITTAAEWELTETVIITKEYLYSMRPPKDGWNESWIDTITEAHQRFDAEILKEFYEQFRSGELTLGQIKDIVRDKVWKSVAKELGLKYKRKKV